MDCLWDDDGVESQGPRNIGAIAEMIRGQKLYGKPSGSSIHWYARMSTLSGYGAELDTGATALEIIPGNFSGRGRTEFLASSGGVAYDYYFTGSAFAYANTGISFPTHSSPIVPVDWDGDGLPDLAYGKRLLKAVLT